MQIKYRLLEKLKNISSVEMDFLLYVARFQNLKGCVVGVHHKDVEEGADICKQSFYTAMRGLEGKGIIQVEKNNQSDWDITILDNDFSYEGAWHEGYVNLHRKVFHSPRFQELKAREKWMLMYFLKNTHENSSSYCIGTKNFYKKFKEELGVSFRVLRSYLHSLRHFFSIGIKKGLYYITYKHSIFEPRLSEGLENTWMKKFVMACCRRYRLSFDRKEVSDTAFLLKQYRTEYEDDQGTIPLGKAIQANALLSEKSLKASYVHTVLRNLLGLE